MLDDCYQDGISGFRPLTGICFSQFWCCLLTILSFESSFRPLTGICFSQYCSRERSRLGHSFRPLTGICFSQFFPLELLERISRPVSVPLRGYVFLNPTVKHGGCLYESVSVPLRGYVFLNDKGISQWESWANWFPSPYGDMFFSILCLQTTGSKGLQRRSAALTAAGFFLNLCASLVTLFFQPFPLQNTSFSLNSQIFQTSAENGCTSMVQAPISYSSPRYFAHFTVWGETPRRRS